MAQEGFDLAHVSRVFEHGDGGGTAQIVRDDAAHNADLLAEFEEVIAETVCPKATGFERPSLVLWPVAP